jgi:Fe-S cluster biosynthesis and repair protein YggX
MADEKRSDSAGTAAQPATQGVHMVKCVKFGKEMPGLDRIPWKGEIGKRVYDNVSKEAWKLWVEHSKMIMNEFRLNPLDPNGMKVMEEQMEMFFLRGRFEIARKLRASETLGSQFLRISRRTAGIR